MVSIKKFVIFLMLTVWVMHPVLAAETMKKNHSRHRTAVSKKHVRPVAKKITPPAHKKIAARKTTLKQPSAKPASIVRIPTYFLTSVEKNLVNFVRNTIQGIRYTTYKLGGTKIDSSRGIYIVDCSTYVDHILKTIYPKAYISLTRWSGTQKPTTHDFYHYFQNLSDDSRHWNTINEVDELRPGDILVFRRKNHYGMETGGHIMIVMEKPERNGNIFLVRIADSAPAGHSEDTRRRHASGIGIGTMLLKVDPHTSRLHAYAWRVGARWESNVNFAMARPVDFG